MSLHYRKSFSNKFLFLLILLNISLQHEVNNKINQIFLIIQIKEYSKSKNNLRELWDETIKYNDNLRKNKDDRDSLEHCRDSDYKYFIHYVAGQTYTFSQFINRDNAVRLNYFI